MFLQKLSKRLLSATTSVVNTHFLRTLNYALGRSETELIDKWKQKFAEENITEIDTSIQHILEHVIEKEKVSSSKILLQKLVNDIFLLFPQPLSELKSDQQITLTEAQLQRFEKLCECRMARMPVQYIIGEWDFCDLVLKMVPPVFIPRPETEELVELILQQCDDNLTMRFLEIGCGSGAISLALLHALPKVILMNFRFFFFKDF